MEVVSLSTVVEVDTEHTDVLLLDLSLFKLDMLEEIVPGTPRDEIINYLIEDAKAYVNGLEPTALDNLLLMYISDTDDDAVIERYNEWFTSQNPSSTAMRYGEALRELFIDELPLDDPNFTLVGAVITVENAEACTIYYSIAESTDEEDDSDE